MRHAGPRYAHRDYCRSRPVIHSPEVADSPPYIQYTCHPNPVTLFTRANALSSHSPTHTYADVT